MTRLAGRFDGHTAAPSSAAAQQIYVVHSPWCRRRTGVHAIQSAREYLPRADRSVDAYIDYECYPHRLNEASSPAGSVHRLCVHAAALLGIRNQRSLSHRVHRRNRQSYKPGMHVCRGIPKYLPHLPILMLAVTHHEDQELEASEAGANDYIAKPFRHLGLIARLTAAIRRGRL